MVNAPAAPAVAGHPRDLVAGHGLSLGCMAAMLLGLLPAWAAPLTAAGFTLVLAWCLLRVLAGRARAAYLRLGVCCLAMAVMLVPSSTAPGPSGMPGMAGTAGDGTSMTGPVGAWTGRVEGVLVVVLASVLVVVAVTAVLAGRRGGVRRGAVVAEALVAALMAAMLLDGVA